MDNPQISGKTHGEVLNLIGLALLQVKCELRLTLPEMGEKIGRSEDQVARYIAGDHEIGGVALLRAIAAWPELAKKIAGGGK